MDPLTSGTLFRLKERDIMALRSPVPLHALQRSDERAAPHSSSNGAQATTFVRPLPKRAVPQSPMPLNGLFDATPKTPSFSTPIPAHNSATPATDEVSSRFEALVRASPMPKVVLGLLQSGSNSASTPSSVNRPTAVTAAAASGALLQSALPMFAAPISSTPVLPETASTSKSHLQSTPTSLKAPAPQSSTKADTRGKSAAPAPVDDVPLQNHLSGWSLRFFGQEKGDMSKIGVEGTRDNAGVKENWKSSIIVTRVDTHRVVTHTGSVYRLVGPINRDEAIAAGLSEDLVDAFADGFPENWRQMLDNYGAKLKEAEKAEAAAKIKASVKTEPRPESSVKKTSAGKTTAPKGKTSKSKHDAQPADGDETEDDVNRKDASPRARPATKEATRPRAQAEESVTPTARAPKRAGVPETSSSATKSGPTGRRPIASGSSPRTPSTVVVDVEAVSVGTSRSGRHLLKPLDWFKNERRDLKGQIILSDKAKSPKKRRRHRSSEGQDENGDAVDDNRMSIADKEPAPKPHAKGTKSRPAAPRPAVETVQPALGSKKRGRPAAVKAPPQASGKVPSKTASVREKENDLDDDFQTGPAAWTEMELQALSLARAEVSPTSKNYWSAVSRRVGSKSADDCQAQAMKAFPTPNHDGVRRKNTDVVADGDNDSDDGDDMLSPTVLGGRGTAKRRKAMRDVVAKVNAGHEADAFDAATPAAAKGFDVDSSLLNDTPEHPSPSKLRPTQTNGHSAAQKGAVVSTGDTPRVKNVFAAIDRDKADEYITSLRKGRRGGPLTLQTKNNSTKKSSDSTGETAAVLIAEISAQDEKKRDAVNERESGDLQASYYFSEDES